MPASRRKCPHCGAMVKSKFARAHVQGRGDAEGCKARTKEGENDERNRAVT